MQHEIGLTGRVAGQSVRTSRKRKAEALQEASDFTQPLFPLACQTLARLVERGASLLDQALVANICEQIVHCVWHGLLRPPGTTSKELDKSLVYKQICRSPEAAMGLLDLMRVLIEPRQLGARPLAPSLLHAFAAIVSTLQCAFERHALQRLSDESTVSGICSKLTELADAIRFDKLERPAESKGIRVFFSRAKM